MNDPQRAEPATPSWTRGDWIALSAVTIAAAAVRLVRLSHPAALMFDETYYAKDACLYAAGAETCELEEVVNEVHPPLGKWAIALGIRVFGYDAFGWRIMPAVAGVVTIALVYLLARKLFSSTLAALFASGLLAFDFLHFVQSRIAMLDVFLVLFGTAAILFVVYDRDRLLTSFGDRGHRAPGLSRHPWRIAAGVALGAAVATKWSGLVYLLAALVLTTAWETNVRRSEGRDAPFLSALRQEGALILLSLVLLPLAVYMLTYAGRLDGDVVTASWDGSWARSFVEEQQDMAGFHAGLGETHPYQSNPWTWPLLKRPVAYFFESTDGGRYDEVIALGNPFVWWASILALVYTTVAWLRRRDPARPGAVIVAGFGFSYLPWVFLALLNDRSAMFLFYLLPAIPFACLSLGYVAATIGRSWEAKTALAAFSGITLALFAYYYPVLASVPISLEGWNDRIIFRDEEACAKPTGPDGGKNVPPKGWCWI